MLVCCQVTFLIILCLAFGFLLGVYLDHSEDLRGLDGLWKKITDAFIFGEDFQRVYEPAEDTFLLLDALENDLDTLKNNVNICLECGSGSGTIITALSKALGSTKLMLATDINPHACRTTKKCAAYHDQDNIEAVRTSLAESFVDRLEDSVDLLLFNPPYVPTEDNESLSRSQQLALSWAGGAQGRNLTDRFLDNFVPRLLSKPNGRAYIVALHQNDVADLRDYLMREHNIRGDVVMERQAGIERLYVIRYQWL